jgi:hypothetical protein
MEGEERLQRVDARVREQCGQIVDGAELAEHQLLARAELLHLEKRRPWKTRREGEQLRAAARVVDGIDVAPPLDRPLHLGRGGLQGHDVARLGGRITHAAERQHLPDVGDVAAAQLLELRVILQVVIAVGQPERGFADEDAVAIGISEIRRQLHIEQRCETRLAEQPRHCLGRLGRRDALQIRLRRREPALLDRRLVHVGGVVIADLLLGSARRRVRGGGLLDDAAHALLGELIEPVEGTEAGVIGRDGKGGVPGATGIGEEVVARPDVRIAGGQIHTEIADGRTIGLRGGCCRQRAGSRGARRGRGSCGHRFLLDGLCGARANGHKRSHPRRQFHDLSCRQLVHQVAPLAGRHRRLRPRFGAEVEEADDGIVRRQSECGLHLSVIGRPAGLPHGTEAERQRGEHHGVRRRTRGQHLLDERYFHRRVAARGDRHDERRAQRLEALAAQRLLVRVRMCATQVRGQQLAEALARRAAHDHEAPRAQPPMIRGTHGAGEDQLERSRIGRRLGQRPGGAARQQGIYGLHGRIVADFRAC